MIDTSLIVVNHQSAGDVSKLLHSLEEHPQSCDYEVIVVNTTPQGAFAKRDDQQNIKIIQMDKNRGYGAAANCGLQIADGQFPMVMNADIMFKDDCLPKMIEHMRAVRVSGVLAPRLLSANGSLQYSARRYYTLFAIACRRTPLGKIYPEALDWHMMKDQDHDKMFAADWCMGAALMIKRDLVTDGKLFDERFFLYFEDVDLCARAWKKGMRVDYFPPATIIHHHQRESAAKPWSRQGRSHLDSMLKFWKKYGTLRPIGADALKEEEKEK